MTPLSNESWYSQFCVAPLPPKTDCDALKSRLYDEYRIEIPLIQWNNKKLIRISIQGYNSRRDVDKLLKALEHITLLDSGKIGTPKRKKLIKRRRS